jgi:hypothetical protein
MIDRRLAPMARGERAATAKAPAPPLDPRIRLQLNRVDDLLAQVTDMQARLYDLRRTLATAMSR